MYGGFGLGGGLLGLGHRLVDVPFQSVGYGNVICFLSLDGVLCGGKLGDGRVGIPSLQEGLGQVITGVDEIAVVATSCSRMDSPVLASSPPQRTSTPGLSVGNKRADLEPAWLARL